MPLAQQLETYRLSHPDQGLCYKAVVQQCARLFFSPFTQVHGQKSPDLFSVQQLVLCSPGFDPRTVQPVASRFIIIIIYLLTAIGLTPGGSSTVHIYTQTIHRTTQ
jgi:hypothetical protein